MTGTFFTLLATALSLLVLDIVFGRGVDIANFPAALIAAGSIGFVNAFIKPILTVLSLPLNFLTLGLFSLVVNGVSFWLASVLVPGFSVNTLWAMILGPVLLSLVSTFLNKYFAERNVALNPGNSDTIAPPQS